MMSKAEKREKEFVAFVKPFFPNAKFGGWGNSQLNQIVTGVSAVINVTEMPNVDDYVKAVDGTVQIDEAKLKRIKGHKDGLGNCTLSIHVNA